MADPRKRVNGPRATTIGDVARRAGVSVSSVSRYVHGEHVRTAVAIEEAITALGFRPSHAAQSLKLGRTMTIALVVPDVTNPFFAAVVRGAETITAEEGYTVLLANTDESQDRERVVLDGLIGRVDGVLLAPASEDDENPLMLRRAGLPVVFIDRSTHTADGQPDVDTVLVDNRGGTRAAVQHLVTHGHRRIAIVSGPTGSTPGRERLDAFRAGLTEHGLPLPDEYVQFGGFREHGGREAMQRLLALPDRPTAVFVANNVMTIGALHALQAAGVRVPDEVSIIGFDDHPFAGLLAPPLTVVDRPMEEQGRVAMHLLLDRINGRVDSDPQRIVARRPVGRTGVVLRSPLPRPPPLIRPPQPPPSPARSSMFESAFWKTPVLQSVLPVVEASRHVRTNTDEITRVAGWLAYEPFGWPQAVLPFDVGDDPGVLTDYQLFLNTLNFAFSDFATGVKYEAERDGRLWSDSEGMVANVLNAIDADVPVLTGAWQARATRDDVARLFSGTIEIPMLDERTAILNAVGAVLVDRYRGRWANWLASCAPSMYAGGDGLLERLPAEFPRFHDVSAYNGREVRLFKLGQLALWGLHTSHQATSAFAVQDLSNMTAFADYIVPVALRLMRIFEYSPELERRINEGDEIPRDSSEEIEIRAHTLYATALLTEAVNAIRPAGEQLVIPQLDYRLWKTYHATFWPHHLTRTIMY